MSLFQAEAERIANRAKAHVSGAAASRVASVKAGMQRGASIEAQRIASGLDAVTGGLPAKLTGRSLASYVGGFVDSKTRPNRKSIVKGGGTPESFWSTRVPLLGGITPREAKEIIENVHGQTYARKNLWMLEVTSNLNGGEQNIPSIFNLFATEVSYSPFIMTGEAVKIGGANYDAVRGHEPSELSITTYDDAKGTIKKWFAAHHRAASSSDGTVAEPGSYAITFRIVHSAITDDTSSGAFETTGYFRPVNLECTLSRSDDGMEEVQMTFAQLDTFMRP